VVRADAAGRRRPDPRDTPPGGPVRAAARRLRLARVSPAWLVAAALAVKAVALVQLHGHPLLQPAGELDTAYYVALAREVAAGDLSAGGRAFVVSPLYVYVLAAVFAATGGSLLAAKVVQIALGAAAVGLVFATARLWFGARIAWLAAGLALLAGPFTFNEVLILQSALDPFLTALSLYVLARAWFGQAPRAWLAAGVILGLHALNRPNVLIVAAATGAWLAAAVVRARLRGRASRAGHPRGERTGPRPAALMGLALGLGAALAPAALHNTLAAGELTLVSSHGGLNFYIGNHAGADGTYRSVPGIAPSIAGQARDARRVAERALGRALTDAEVSAYFYRLAWEWIRTHPADALRLLARKVAYTFNAADVALNYSYAYYARDEPTILRWLVVGPWLLLPLGLFGLAVARPAPAALRRAWWPWAAYVPAYGLAVAIFFVSGRYRLPLLVPLALTSAAALGWFAAAVRARRRRAAAAAALLAGLALATNRDAGLDDGRAGERMEMIVHLVDSGRDAEAMALLESTVPMARDLALLYFRAGQAFFERGEAARAVPLLRRAHDRAPDRPEIRLVLGQALLDAGRPVEAAPHLLAALESGVRPDLAAFDLARARAAGGDRAGARAALRRIPHPAGLDAASQLAAGRLALELGDADFALAVLQAAVRAAPADASLAEALGLALEAAGRRDEAIAALERACALDGRSATARLNLAVLLAERGRTEAARRLAEEALAIRPDYVRARQFLEALAPGRRD
jgi:tetratricopeptide (TPR) repeat protein